jgi:hypothetical protein
MPIARISPNVIFCGRFIGCHLCKEKDRPKAVSCCRGQGWKSPNAKRLSVLLSTIREEANSKEAQHHHGPSGGLGDC